MVSMERWWIFVLHPQLMTEKTKGIWWWFQNSMMLIMMNINKNMIKNMFPSSTHSWCPERTQMRGKQMHWSSLSTISTSFWIRSSSAFWWWWRWKLWSQSLSLNYHKILQSSYCAGDQLTIADFSILASVTQLEGMDYRITSYPSVSHHVSSYSLHILIIFSSYLIIFYHTRNLSHHIFIKSSP